MTKAQEKKIEFLTELAEARRDSLGMEMLKFETNDFGAFVSVIVWYGRRIDGVNNPFVRSAFTSLLCPAGRLNILFIGR